MERKFSASEFVHSLGERLVKELSFAHMATTPELKGNAVEQPIRQQLEEILPSGIGVGSGCVIDLRGNVSRQMDIVLYEKELCPRFSVGRSPEATYYPIEGVMAVGEVKSSIGKGEIGDAFNKIQSVKLLRREYQMHNELQVGRVYGDVGTNSAFQFDLRRTNRGDVYGFIIAKNSRVNINTLQTHYANSVIAMQNDVLCPDRLVLLSGHSIFPVPIRKGKDNIFGPLTDVYIPTRARAVLPHGINVSEVESPLGQLVGLLWHKYQTGLTAHIPLTSYLHYSTVNEIRYNWMRVVHYDLQTMVQEGRQNIATTPVDHLQDAIQMISRNR